MRGKNKKEKLEDFFKNVVKSADGVLVAGVKVGHCVCVRKKWMVSDVGYSFAPHSVDRDGQKHRILHLFSLTEGLILVTVTKWYRLLC